MNVGKLIIGIVFGILAQIITFFQLQGQSVINKNINFNFIIL